jgi:hypothetical protein
VGLKLIGEVALDGSGFERGLSRLGSTAASSLKNFVVGAVGVVGVHQAITRTVEACDQLVHGSERLGVVPEQFQVMQEAAKRAGIDIGLVQQQVMKLAAMRGNILAGGPNSAKQLAALGKLGVTPDMVRTQTGGQWMQSIGATLQGVNPNDVANELKTLFGRSFGTIMPYLTQDFGALAAKMQRFGLIVDTDTAVRVKYFSDELQLVSRLLVVQVAPLLVKFADAAVWAIKKISGAGSFWGAAVGPEKWSWKDVGKWALLGQNAPVIGGKKLDMQAGVGAMSETEAEWNKKQKEWADEFAKEADKLRHPKPVTVPEQMEVGGKSYKPTGDALVAVGNFLGAGRYAIGSSAQQQLEKLTHIGETLDDINSKMDGIEAEGVDYD